MLRRIGSSARYAECSRRAAEAYRSEPCFRDVQALLRPSRSISSTCIRSARSVLKEDERHLMTEIGMLRREAAVYDVGVDGMSKDESTLPPVTEEMLETVYRALNVPDEPTDEEMRLEQRRVRAIESPSSRQQRRALLADVSIKRLGKALDRLNQMDSFLEGFHSSDNVDHVTNILTMIRTREDEDSAIDAAESAEQNRSLAESINVDDTRLAHIEALRPADVLSRFRRSLEGLQQVSQSRDDVPIVPQTLFSLQDWKAVVRLSASATNLTTIAEALQLMKSSGFTTKMRTQVANVAMDFYATQGDVATVQQLLSTMLAEQVDLDAYSRHCLVKCYVKAERYEEAIGIVQSFESSTPAPLTTYTLLIGSLMQLRDQPHLQMKIWPIFQQMRMKAHPVPDAPMYAHMITACALGIPKPHDNMFKPSVDPHTTVTHLEPPKRLTRKTRSSDAERGLDLFREMTTRYQVRPTPEVYAAVISACAGRREFYQTSLRIFQSMLDKERERADAQQHDAPSFAPDRVTFNALLRGCARNGDLKRARWILAEMLRGTVAVIESLRRSNTTDLRAEDVDMINARRPDTHTIVQLLYAYANYVMPAETMTKKKGRRTAVKRVTHYDDDDELAFSNAMPTSAFGILREVDGLLERIISDQQRTDGLLSTVKPNTKMMTAYFAVILKWALASRRRPFRRAQSVLFGSSSNENMPFGGMSLYERWSLPIDELTCKAVLEICEHVKAGDTDIDAINRLADEVWTQWRQSQQHGVSANVGDGLSLLAGPSSSRVVKASPQDVSDCWAGRIRFLAKVNRIDEAMSVLCEFVQLYPPRNHFGDQRKRLTGDVANLQFYISNAGGFERPALTFMHLDVLQQRLRLPRVDRSDSANKRDLLYVIWAAKAYEKDVKPRLPEVLLKAKPYVERYVRPGSRK